MAERNIEGDLLHGLKIGEKTVTHYVLRPATVGDMMDAEEEAPPSSIIRYGVALLGRQLVRLDDLSGPFTSQVLRQLDPKDLDALSIAQANIEGAGDTLEKK